MRVKFLADASLDHKVVAGLRRREPAVDCLGANEAKLAGVPDQGVLALAAREGRVLITADRKTMPREFGNFVARHGKSPGVFLVSQKLPVAVVIENLLLIWAASDAADWENRICSIPV